jgi:hypothetical protein
MRIRLGLVAALVSIWAGPAWGRFAYPQEVPVERLVKNVGAYVKEHPKDAQGYYTLGRVNYLALSMKSTTVRAFEAADPKNLPAVPEFFQVAGKTQPDEARLKQYLAAAVENFGKAIELKPDVAMYHMGMASVMEAALHSGLELGAAPGSKGEKAGKEKDAWREGAIAEYLKAFDLAVEKDAALQHMPIRGLRELVSYEAGKRYLAMVNERGAKDGEAEQVAKVDKALDGLEKKPRGPITPIIFSYREANGLGELLDPERHVTFDLDGTGRGQAWPWVKPGTAILVWDPKGTGRIESGRQLFGSVTWWIFWRDGYAALDALDDDRDGWLSGDELKGLAVWTDRNGNGVSDAGEVMSLESAGVEGISTRRTDTDGLSPMNRMGIRMKDGRVVGSWDWVVEPVSQSRSRRD